MAPVRTASSHKRVPQTNFPPVLLILLRHRHRSAQTLTLIHDDSMRDNTYETLQLTLQTPPTSGPLAVSLQDARGGPAITRTIPAGNTRRMLFPLPLVNLPDLSPAQWPIRINVQVQGTPDHSSIIPIARQVASATNGALRLAVRQDADPDPKLVAALSPLPVVLVRYTLDEILHESPLAFACCDALWLDDATAAQLSAGRALELIAAGPKLIYHGPSAPGNLLASLFWEPSSADAQLWQLPAAALPHLHPVEPLLLKLPRLTPQVPSGLRQAAFAAIPICIALVLLLRVFTARPIILLTITAGLFIVVTTITIAAMSHSNAQQLQQQIMTWSTRPAPGSLAITQTLQQHTTLFPQTAQFKNNPLPLLPLAASAPEWFHLANSTIQLDNFSTTLEIPARRQRYIYTRSIAATAHMDPPPGPAALGTWGPQAVGSMWTRGFLITAGQVTPTSTSSPPHPDTPFQTFTQWLPLQPTEVQPTLRAWYELTFQPDHIYHLTLPESASQKVSIIDLSYAKMP